MAAASSGWGEWKEEREKKEQQATTKEEEERYQFSVRASNVTSLWSYEKPGLPAVRYKEREGETTYERDVNNMKRWQKLSGSDRRSPSRLNV